MGEVFRTQHRRMERVVAIKTLPAATLKDPSAVARFQREVVAAAKLRHPNIVAADDADEAGGVHFLVMEYINGRDLWPWSRRSGRCRSPRPSAISSRRRRELDFALSERARSTGDIKPANLLLDREGTVKVLDMGLARRDEGPDVVDPERESGPRTGAVDGDASTTWRPEQAMSTKTRRRAGRHLQPWAARSTTC